jgi:hypothetical protein
MKWVVEVWLDLKDFIFEINRFCGENMVIL